MQAIKEEVVVKFNLICNVSPCDFHERSTSKGVAEHLLAIRIADHMRESGHETVTVRQVVS